MTARSPITVADLEAGASRLAADPRLGGARPQQRAVLRDLHDLLIAAVPSSPEPPSVLTHVTAVVERTDPAAADGMQPRARTVFRLLRAGHPAAAWALVTENAVGRVNPPFTGSTATGTRRTARALPVPIRIEAATVYAALPGFRDPQYDAPDECYDISAAVRLDASADDASVDGDIVTLGGSAALTHLPTLASEQLRVVLVGVDGEVSFPGRRHPRPDLFPGRVQLPVRRDWVGWSAGIACSVLPASSWRICVELAQGRILRRAPAGISPDGGGIGRAGSTIPVGDTHRVEVDAHGWWLVTAGAPIVRQVPG